MVPTVWPRVACDQSASHGAAPQEARAVQADQNTGFVKSPMLSWVILGVSK